MTEPSEFTDQVRMQPDMYASSEPRRDSVSAADRGWRLLVAAVASAVMSWPLIVYGTPDVESYAMSIFSTVAFASNLVAGVDPWFVPGFGFGIPLPTSTWFVKFPPAIPAALLGSDILYAAIWLVGQFVFSLYFLKLCRELMRHRTLSVVLLVTALLSFSNLGTSYVDDWPEHFLGWALFPMCLWFILRTLTSVSGERIRTTAACAVALGIFTGCAHQNEMVTFYSGMGVVLLFFLPTRLPGVLAVGAAIGVALLSALDVLVPTVQGISQGVNPMTDLVEIGSPEFHGLRASAYGVFLEPVRTLLAAGPDGVLESSYQRVPFFGLLGLMLATLGAVRPFRSRAPVLSVPNDVARGIAAGFCVYSVLTLMPPWVALNLPRMWMYRDGQTVFGLLCAAMALGWIWETHTRLLVPALALHLVQIGLVAAPILLRVAAGADDAPIYGYSRREHVLFDALREAGVDAKSRVLLAGRVEGAIRGRLTEMGITAGTDFPLEGLSLVNGWYRGALTPLLGQAPDGRYGAYVTYLAWDRNLWRLSTAGLDVLGITHVAVLEDELAGIDLVDDLTPVGAIDLPDQGVLRVFANEDAWTRAVLLSAGDIDDPPASSSCPQVPDVFCRDYAGLSRRLQSRLMTDVNGSSIHITLPPGHQGGTIFVSAAVGPNRSATVDGQRRKVDLVMDTFGTLAVRSGEQRVVVSAARTGRIALSLVGVAALLVSFAIAVAPSVTRFGRA